jgi:uncharacterized membrane protein
MPRLAFRLRGHDSWTALAAAIVLLATLIINSHRATASSGAVSDPEAVAIAHKHCVICHAAKPALESFQEAPNNVTLETVADLKKYAQPVYLQTV